MKNAAAHYLCKPLALKGLRMKNNSRISLHHARQHEKLGLAMNSRPITYLAPSGPENLQSPFNNLALHTKKAKRVGGYDNADLGRTNSVYCGGLKNSHFLWAPRNSRLGIEAIPVIARVNPTEQNWCSISPTNVKLMCLNLGTTKAISLVGFSIPQLNHRDCSQAGQRNFPNKDSARGNVKSMTTMQSLWLAFGLSWVLISPPSHQFQPTRTQLYSEKKQDEFCYLQRAGKLEGCGGWGVLIL